MRLKELLLNCYWPLWFFVYPCPRPRPISEPLLPFDDIVSQEDNKKIALEVKFIHPMELHYMEMVKPERFGALHKGKTTDLLSTLKEAKGKSPDQTEDYTFWKTDFQIKRPGDYTFFVQPQPYWEPAEDLFIVHYTKVCVNAFGLEEGWD